MLKRLLLVGLLILSLLAPLPVRAGTVELNDRLTEATIEWTLLEIERIKGLLDQDLRDQINKGMRVDGTTIHLYLEYIDYSTLWKNLQYVRVKSPKILVIHLFSFGGSVFDAMAMVGLIEEIQRGGTIVEIRAKGLAASAGLIILVSGSPEHRYIDKNAMVMFHELQSLSFFKIETPTSKEDEAKVLRKIQDKINNYIATRSRLSVEELRKRISRQEFWLDADEAVRVGLADKIE